MRKLINDLRYGLRQLAKHPLYSPIAVVTLALGIGANAAIFTVINAALFKPLPYADEARLVVVREYRTDDWQALFLPGGLPRQTFSRTVIKSAQLREDFAVMKKALTSLHPGLYRHVDAKAMERHFDELEQELRRDLTTAEAYLAFSKFLARIKCGHTYANFWNQTEGVKQEVFGQADKVPFTFRLIDKRMILTRSALDDDRVRQGMEILAIDGVPAQAILEKLMSVVKGDGSNYGKRLHDLQLEGVGEFEAFDVYFPLFYPVKKGQYRVEAYDPRTRKKFSFTAPALTRSQRSAIIEKRYGQPPSTYDDLWQFKLLDEQTAYLRLGTFVTWRMKMDWKAFLKNSFQQLGQKEIKNLIVDIRGNEGGADEVNLVLRQYLLWKQARIEGARQLLRYSKIPVELDPYLDTWDKSFKNRENQVVDLGNGYYTWKGVKARDVEIEASKTAFPGKIYMLVNAANSSATFYLASLMKNNQLATLVGQETGGNRRGLNGGQMFFLRLPNSQIEMDLPLIGSFPLKPQPDQGILPDVQVKPSVENVVKGIDAELETVKQLIATQLKRRR